MFWLLALSALVYAVEPGYNSTQSVSVVKPPSTLSTVYTTTLSPSSSLNATAEAPLLQTSLNSSSSASQYNAYSNKTVQRLKADSQESTTTLTATHTKLVTEKKYVTHSQELPTGLLTHGNVVYKEVLVPQLDSDSESSTTSTIELATTAVVEVLRSTKTHTLTIYVATHTPLTTSIGSIETQPILTVQQPLVTKAISKGPEVSIVTSVYTVPAVISAIPVPIYSPDSSESEPKVGSKSGTPSSSSPASFGTGSSSQPSFNSSTGSFNSSRGTLNSTYNSGYNRTFANFLKSLVDLFAPILTEEPLSIFKRQAHPLEVPEGVEKDLPIQTNKFYANLFLLKQTDPVWTYPYGLFYLPEKGMGVMYTPKSSRVLGHDVGISSKGADYLTSPVGVAGMLFGAVGQSSFSLNVLQMTDLSVNVGLKAGSGYIELPLVLGMGMVTGIYHGLTPLLQSSAGFKSLTTETGPGKGITKYKATLFSDEQWLIYLTGSSQLLVNSDNFLEGTQLDLEIMVQVAVLGNSSTKAEDYYDMAAGMYVVSAKTDGSVGSDMALAEYGFVYETKGSSESGKPLVFALPHHVESLSSETAQTATGIGLDSTTKGTMYGFLTLELKMQEELNREIGYAPWSQQLKGSTVSWTPEQLQLIASTASEELAADIKGSVKSTDTYTAGKLLDRFAYILYVVLDVLNDTDATQTALTNLKSAFEVFTENNQEYPLFYDTTFKGVTLSANNNGDIGADYLAGYYNDHHFHYGYYVHAAAVIAYVDKKVGDGTWAQKNGEWVNLLIRDVANPSTADLYFPVLRMFDWFHGHSWAAGLFTLGAGKNQESSSEDYNFSYGMKMWAQVIGDQAMESRADLMIAITKRSMNDYMYYSDDNSIEPKEIVANKVLGIFYENKIAYTTFFGTNPEYIHGIHMLPVTPVSSNIRGPTFVQQEWKEYILDIIGSVNSGWTGVLRMNQALYDPKGSYEYFSSSSFDSKQMDNGQSRTWALAFSAALANGVESK